jgi:hypothetical protein
MILALIVSLGTIAIVVAIQFYAHRQEIYEKSDEYQAELALKLITDAERYRREDEIYKATKELEDSINPGWRTKPESAR